jgi:peptide-methionine (R)-S-oxide reductase
MKGLLWAIVALAACGQQGQPGITETKHGPERKDKVVRTEAEWRKLLTADQYRILRRGGTEPAFCEVMPNYQEPGTYHCVGCDLELFRNDAKFESMSGWPSFFQPAVPDAVWYKADFTAGMRRTEILCSRCDGHLGHVFSDGPKPTGLRFCVNGTVLKFWPLHPQPPPHHSRGRA